MSTSRISIDVESFAATEPTMAVLTYLTTPPMPTSTTSANPASLYCTHLGGMELGATTGRGGGWITDARAMTRRAGSLHLPDGSMIDSWGITYHTDGAIRGADLKPLLAYQASEPPIIFPEN
jgi:putative hemolysin